MERIIQEVAKIYRNIKKSSNRGYARATLIAKQNTLDELKAEFDLLAEQNEDNKEILPLKLEFCSIHTNSQKLISEQLKTAESRQELGQEEELEEDEKDQLPTMAAFNLETASKALPTFSGNFKELDSFLITAELVNKTLSSEGKIDFLQYVYHAKLTANVRTSLGSYLKPSSFEILKQQLQTRYKDNTTIAQLQTKLNNLQQRNLRINTYKEQLLNIIEGLNRLGIESLGTQATEAEKNVIIKCNNKHALDAFKKGLNENLKTTIYAARPKDLLEATELALELENESMTAPNTIMHFQRSFNQHRNNVNTRGNMRQNFSTQRNFNSFNSNTRQNEPRRYNNNFNQNYNQNNYHNRNLNHNNNVNRNRDISNRSNQARNSNQNRNRNNNNNYNGNRYTNNQTNRNIRIINNEGNYQGSEDTVFPDSQN